MSEKLWPDAYISTEDHKATLTEKDRIIRDLESSHRDQLADLSEELAERDRQIAELQQWVNDLQSGMYINCVYCGHRYGPKENTPVSMAEILKAHVEQCPKHPMSYLKKENARLIGDNLEAAKQIAALTGEIHTLETKARELSKAIVRRNIRHEELESILREAEPYAGAAVRARIRLALAAQPPAAAKEVRFTVPPLSDADGITGEATPQEK